MRNCKEYLDANCNYEFVRSNKKYDGFIEIPEGAEVAILDDGRISFAKPMNDGDDVLVLDVGRDLDWDTTEWDSWSDFVNYGFDIIWQRPSQPEALPFVDDEPSLNDQYAEIEQVRQAIKVKSGSNSDHALDAMSFGLMGAGAAQASGGVDATLAERQSQYGCYKDVAHVTQQILSALRIGNYDELPAPMKESLHMIASKMARIVIGDPEYLDNWHDIGGYAKLIEKLIKVE